MRIASRLSIGFVMVTLTSPAAESPLSTLNFSPGKSGGAVNTPLQIVLLLTVLTVLPAVIMSVTPFLRISIVLHFLRQALGTQGTPSNQVLIGLALFLTVVIMQPVAMQMYERGWVPMERGELSASQAFDAGTEPLKEFLVRYVREKDVRLFIEATHAPAPAKPSDVGLNVLVPAYILSELKTGFQIGVVLFLPFLIIDLVVASITLSVGMIQLPPVMLSAPFKILLFVLVDGWNLVVGSLLRSFYRV
ncbi:MAG TPA: flagellar type III secretion system pore protein FliP [Bryobacteraceae bacterium]|nr:flagellar type III secretion system pore protein FliP [Bryobacteraceae bacterium]